MCPVVVIHLLFLKFLFQVSFGDCFSVVYYLCPMENYDKTMYKYFISSLIYDLLSIKIRDIICLSILDNIMSNYSGIWRAIKPVMLNRLI
jgi:hypothetical protein